MADQRRSDEDAKETNTITTNMRTPLSLRDLERVVKGEVTR